MFAFVFVDKDSEAPCRKKAHIGCTKLNFIYLGHAVFCLKLKLLHRPKLHNLDAPGISQYYVVRICIGIMFKHTYYRKLRITNSHAAGTLILVSLTPSRVTVGLYLILFHL